MRVVQLLLDPDARLDAKDTSPSCTCATTVASPRALEIALLLAERGADPNLHNRLGDLALLQSAITGMCRRLARGRRRPVQAEPVHNALDLARFSPDILDAFTAAAARAAAAVSQRLVGRRARLANRAAGPQRPRRHLPGARRHHRPPLGPNAREGACAARWTRRAGRTR
jgi:hypothetical protein